jgi:hypothetical protein
MSRHRRKKHLWPSDDLAVHIWHMVAVTDDIADLVEASKLVREPDAKVAMIKKALVDLKSFDDLVAELRRTLYAKPNPPMPESAVAPLKDALHDYDKELEPSRDLLAKIRNNLGAHRRGLPGDKERKKFKTDFLAWGEWEQILNDLEAECTLDRWTAALNAAVRLRNLVTKLGLGSWYSINGDEMRLYFPLGFDGGERGDPAA